MGLKILLGSDYFLIPILSVDGREHVPLSRLIGSLVTLVLYI